MQKGNSHACFADSCLVHLGFACAAPVVMASSGVPLSHVYRIAAVGTQVLLALEPRWGRLGWAKPFLAIADAVACHVGSTAVISHYRWQHSLTAVCFLALASQTPMPTNTNNQHQHQLVSPHSVKTPTGVPAGCRVCRVNGNVSH